MNRATVIGKKKVAFFFPFSKLDNSLIFNPRFQNKVSDTVQLPKPDKFSPLAHFKDGFLFSKK
jgi:hypothetical protein